MPSAVLRDHRLKPLVIESLRKEDWVPPRNTIRREMKQLGLRGNASDDVKWLRGGHAVSADMAAYLTNWVQEHPLAAPSHLAALVEDKTEEEAIRELFEIVEPIAYRDVDEVADPTGPGLVRFGAWALDVFRDLIEPRSLWDSPAVYFDPETGPEDYARHVYTESGYAQSGGQRVRAPLSTAQAMERGMKFLDDEPAFHHKLGRMALDLNPNCLRYAVNTNGQRVGMSLVLPITEAAWKATHRGERSFYDGHRPEELRKHSNILLIPTLAEVYDEPIAPTVVNTTMKRHVLMHSLFVQVALLLDTTKIESIRVISYEIIDSNKSRLSRAGFEVIGEDKSQMGPPINIVAFDSGGPRQRLEDDAKSILSSSAWRLRARLEGINPRAWGL